MLRTTRAEPNAVREPTCVTSTGNAPPLAGAGLSLPCSAGRPWLRTQTAGAAYAALARLLLEGAGLSHRTFPPTESRGSAFCHPISGAASVVSSAGRLRRPRLHGLPQAAAQHGCLPDKNERNSTSRRLHARPPAWMNLTLTYLNQPNSGYIQRTTKSMFPPSSSANEAARGRLPNFKDKADAKSNKICFFLKYTADAYNMHAIEITFSCSVFYSAQ